MTAQSTRTISKRPLKAFIRYGGDGKAVAGSLLLRKDIPKVGNWVEIPAYECCNYDRNNPINPT